MKWEWKIIYVHAVVFDVIDANCLRELWRTEIVRVPEIDSPFLITESFAE